MIPIITQKNVHKTVHKGAHREVERVRRVKMEGPIVVAKVDRAEATLIAPLLGAIKAKGEKGGQVPFLDMTLFPSPPLPSPNPTASLHERKGFLTPFLPRFLEEVYNARRLHSALGYLPPAEFERRQPVQNKKEAATRLLPL